MRRCEHSPRSKADLSDIYQRILEQDPATAILVVDRIESTIQSVCVFPRIGKLTQKRNVWVFGGTTKNPFRIAYRFDDDAVTVLRIFRAGREHTQY